MVQNALHLFARIRADPMPTGTADHAARRSEREESCTRLGRNVYLFAGAVFRSRKKDRRSTVAGHLHSRRGSKGAGPPLHQWAGGFLLGQVDGPFRSFPRQYPPPVSDHLGPIWLSSMGRQGGLLGPSILTDRRLKLGSTVTG